MASGGTVRKKKPVRVPSEVISVFVAEPLTKAKPAFISVGVAALTSLLPAGPMTPRTFEASGWAARAAEDGVALGQPQLPFLVSLVVAIHIELDPVVLQLAERGRRPRDRFKHAHRARGAARDQLGIGRRRR